MSVWTEEEGWALPQLEVAVPGPASVAAVDILARHECPGITARRARAGEARGGRDPIVWARAKGGNVWDLDGNRYVDLSGAFGVALIGHGHPAVVAAVEDQAGDLLHAMSDLYPNQPRIALMERLARISPPGLDQCILASGGAEAVEAALKTAALASGRPGVLAFWGGYHGLSYGTLAVTAYRRDFRRPFAGQLGPHVTHLPYGCDLELVDQLLRGPATGGEQIGAILVEPIQGRGGEVVPPPGWLPGLRRIADERDIILVFDEIYTGLGRTGDWWAGAHEGVVPDVMTLGKALAGGMPIGACVANAKAMAGWGRNIDEAIHTSTFLGNPVTAAAALAALDVMEAMEIPGLARALEAKVRARFGERVRGRGAMLGLKLAAPGLAAPVTERLLDEGFIGLPGGVEGDILGITPPLMLHDTQLDAAFEAIERAVAAEEGAGA